MEVTEAQSCPGYANGPPWLFKGSALYQLHLVKAETARSFIPKEFRLVEAFGYTLGGFFFARYSDSPAGMFDELVVIAGIVWNPPTSCAWAARVLVNSDKACIHGRKEIGLPSHVARFSKFHSKQRLMTTLEKPKSKCSGFLNMLGIGTACSQNDRMDIEVTEIMGPAATALCNINLPSAASESKSHRKWLGPAIKMSLPSFSGHTEYNPHLLKYSCQIECRVRAVEPAKISGPTTPALQFSKDKSSDDPNELRKVVAENDALRRSISVLLSRPILALELSSLKMEVEAPTIVTPRSKNVVVHS